MHNTDGRLFCLTGSLKRAFKKIAGDKQEKERKKK